MLEQIQHDIYLICHSELVSESYNIEILKNK